MVTAEQVEQIASAAAEKALKNLLVVMGVDASDNKAIISLQKDFATLRALRISIEKMRTQGLLTALGIFITFVSGAVWLAVRGH